MLDHHDDIVFLILAAGQASRMGSPKQNLKWGKTNLLSHTIEQCGNSKKVIVLGAHLNKISPLILDKVNTEIIVNLDWKKGIGSSISFGVKHIIQKHKNCKGILITLADTPFISALDYSIIIQKSIENPNSIIASKNQKSTGVPAYFPTLYFGELMNLNKDIGAKFIIKNHLKKVVTINNSNTLFDIDTPEEYQTLLSIKKASKN